ncbi:MAG: threonine--tRNA ligase [bacterium (Candidatus Stahlbacteria) CG23_combo_of_CG06-09_8_20_14_all_40_9]|nr:MAG: threonine--tRNA ligase [bacterium (Candidatus Stahlbacteria) CG23_combo_of_CG06-09_8_20_14_all_40_9]
MKKLKIYKKGTRLEDVVDNDSIIAAIVNGEVRDLSYILPEDAEVRFLTPGDEEGRKIYWHSTAHILAYAVKRLYPNAKLAIGPAIEDGFYYDFGVEKPFTPEEITRIEEEMKKIIEENLPFEREELSINDAIKLFKKFNEDYKIELLYELEGSVSIYKNNGFIDLCKGPHIPSTGRIRFFKLTASSGAYWRGDETRKMLQRIYGVSFERREELENYLERIKEAKKRDHRTLGSDLGLWMMDEEIGAGLVVWLSRGMTVRKIIEDFWWDEHKKRGYDFILSPHIARTELWKQSGHLDYYSDLIYPVIKKDNQSYLVKPMNCPFHIKVYKQKRRSYRELPIRLAELGTVYRYEKSGVLHGLLRVRGFTQDDAHIFCMASQAKNELIGVIQLARDMFSAFGFKDYKVDLSVWDINEKDKYMGDEKDWQDAESSLISALEETGLSYKKKVGEAAFYGPKIDIKILDALQREWQATTIQFDFNLPQRFNLKFMGEDGQQHSVIVIHRAILGSIERFVGTLVEHYTGKFPLWLAPLQVKVLPITSEINQFAESIREKLTSAGIRAETDDRNEKLSLKIRETIIEKVPYIVIVGQREIDSGCISARSRNKGDIGRISVSDFVSLLKEEIEKKSN